MFKIQIYFYAYSKYKKRERVKGANFFGIRIFAANLVFYKFMFIKLERKISKFILQFVSLFQYFNRFFLLFVRTHSFKCFVEASMSLVELLS